MNDSPTKPSRIVTKCGDWRSIISRDVAGLGTLAIGCDPPSSVSVQPSVLGGNAERVRSKDDPVVLAGSAVPSAVIIPDPMEVAEPLKVQRCYGGAGRHRGRVPLFSLRAASQFAERKAKKQYSTSGIVKGPGNNAVG
jgi:hypothetical protein